MKIRIMWHCKHVFPSKKQHNDGNRAISEQSKSKKVLLTKCKTIKKKKKFLAIVKLDVPLVIMKSAFSMLLQNGLVDVRLQKPGIAVSRH